MFADVDDEERAALEAAGLILFEERLIFDAQPPLDDLTRARIEKVCAGPLPEGLLALWATSFGGHLGYDLTVAFGEFRKPFSLCELFYPESDGYHDLWGWIEHEQELAEAEVLDFLPFGGFEYLERVYAQVRPGPGHGRVLAWTHGLPPAWHGQLHEDRVAEVAEDVPALFRKLAFLAPLCEDDQPELLEALDGLDDHGPPGASAKAKLLGHLRTQILDWRAALAAGTLGEVPELRAQALAEAAGEDDEVSLARLEAAGCALDEPVRGDLRPLDLALAAGAYRAARYLLAQGVPVGEALRSGAGRLTAELIDELLVRGAEPCEHAVLGELLDGDPALARRLAAAALARRAGARAALVAALREQAAGARTSAAQLDAGKLFSNLTAAEYRVRARKAEALAAELEAAPA